MKTTNRLIATLLVGLMLLPLAACAQKPEPISEAKFLAQMEGSPSYVERSLKLDGEEFLLGLAEGLCDNLSEEATQSGREQRAHTFRMAAQDSGLDPMDTEVFMVAAIDRFCPEITIE